MAAGDYAAVIVDRIDHATRSQYAASRGLLNAIQNAIDGGDTFDAEQTVSLMQDLSVLRYNPTGP